MAAAVSTAAIALRPLHFRDMVLPSMVEPLRAMLL
jgi:hypothetical protein